MSLRPPSFDPRAVPVRAVDAHLAAHPSTWLEADALRQHFAQVPLVAPERPGDGGRLSLRATRAASVLIPLVRRETGLQVLLTRRTEHLKDHAGQISFPGGRVEPEDADAWATALREAQEEIGLNPSWVEPLGQLPLYRTVTAYDVTPCVGLVRPGFALQLDAGEVAEAFEVPLAFLMDPAQHRWHRLKLLGFERDFLSMPWTQQGREYFIWGATAAMLRNLYHQLAQGR
ncbi:8-oxo-dGTP pyrophosphatase MutT (NUDIX family) [Inhella inkyongensis]|uniref:8-oxo-dGTP pyrophosphatase MutT (NUDIX family) n=1 Tax=Inhella inkyongensis TaxID=392593 RepID=A0A840SBE3_9BURK|nr:CoA pyrophosphatase [Inhella inkyongensis]MBB5206104.1 8-oxo-dGTP pyrophosphatase MutT (NUDIX family) [Inhella inkyongensis]